MLDPRFILPLTLSLVIATSVIRCGDRETPAKASDPEIVILISIDGFRYDYMTMTETPALDRIVASGVRAQSLIPVFPSKTFPNHYSIVTGLYPENHGIVANTMWDSIFQETFYIGAGSSAAQDGKWYGGEPIWVTAEKQNITAATYFWPGSDAEIQGVRPTHYKVFDNTDSYTTRVDQVIDWLQMETPKRPGFISLYFESVDSKGHSQGPTASETMAEVRNVDAQIGRLLDGIKDAGLEEYVNLIVVSDHGMSELSRDRVIFLDNYIDAEDVSVINWSPVTDIRPDEDKADEVLAALQGAHPNYHVYPRSEVPSELHYSAHHRISPIIGITDDGWSVTTHDHFNNNPNAFTGATHGFRPENETMHGIFLATGPSFVQGSEVPSFENIHIYVLMCKILGLDPAENDGNLAIVSSMLNN